MEDVGLSGVSLALSLHAVDDATRSKLVPLNDQFNIAAVLNACQAYLKANPRPERITFEFFDGRIRYVMLEDVNDSLEEARKLVKLLKPFSAEGQAHVNLIPFNPWPGSQYTTSSAFVVEEFAAILRKARIPVNIRTPRGRDILAACGQLRSSKTLKRSADVRSAEN
ncbi:hypothetical protein BDK51DRAFT_33766 [Blyttiomyces helicus]|uniref:Radical SAM core domain-containing protein n=1 Tax=Blyttiomyces helicus TaxID=388810 RepID=A0A4P9VYJ0_9FUNG|nr:hypothetical protein BDK51DRAFT_33766 [Blyttiomyces helicus]|eukprot:RKO82856.1 hypothetical protein BDK51DRAFT_33766 [Blyttiomyces helicus]